MENTVLRVLDFLRTVWYKCGKEKDLLGKRPMLETKSFSGTNSWVNRF